MVSHKVHNINQKDEKCLIWKYLTLVLYYIKITGRELFNQFKIIKGVKSFTTRKNYDDIKTDSFQILKP